MLDGHIIKETYKMHGKQFLPVLVLICALGLAGMGFWYRCGLPRGESGSSIVINRDVFKDVQNLAPVVIIGSGPAGLAAALYTSRMNWPTYVFEGPQPGGQLTETSVIENWPGVGSERGPVLMSNAKDQVRAFGATFSPETITRVDLKTRYPYTLWTDEGREIRAAAIIVATGAQALRLGIEGEDTYWSRGVSTCAVCDAFFYKGKIVAVAGGGDSAAEEALELATFAEKVIMLVRGERLRASPIMQKRLRSNPRIEIRFKTKPNKVIGDGNHVTSLDITNAQGKHEVLAVNALFLGIGHTPNTDVFKDQLLRSERGHIMLVGPGQATSKPCVFVAGDATDAVYRQAGVAAGDGIKAALDLDRCLEEHGIESDYMVSLEKQFYKAFKDDIRVTLPLITSSKELDTHLVGAKGPIILDFYADYCPSCMQMLPVFEGAAAHFGNKATFLKTDTAKSDELSKRFDVTMIPTFLIFKNGSLVARSAEAMNKQALIELIAQHV